MILLPQPREVIQGTGMFQLNSDTVIQYVHTDVVKYATAKKAKEQIKIYTGLELPVVKVIAPGAYNVILLETCECLGEEDYKLTITPEMVKIIGGSDAGVFYGIMTLSQIVAQSQSALPAVTINDKPEFRVRGFYHDAARGEVPSLETFKKLIDICASFKINQFQFYVEHSFAYKEFREMWSDVDPITPEEILILDEYCKERHIDLVPSIATFGHLFRLLTSKCYAHLSELEGSENDPFTYVGKLRHHTLDVSNPESAEIVTSMIEQVLPLFSSKLFNICADETFDLGKGKNKELAEKYGVGKLYVDFIKKIVAAVTKHGKRVMMWDDILIKHPESLGELPKDVILLHWDYRDFPLEEQVKLVSASGAEFYQCPAVWSWNLLLPRMRFAHNNILNTAKYAKQYRPAGILTTNWGDYGNINFLTSSLPGMIQGASYSWNPDADHDFAEINEKIAKLYYQDVEGTLVNLVSEASEQSLFPFHNYIFYIEGYGQLNLEITYDQIVKANERLAEIINIFYGKLASAPCRLRLDVQEFIHAMKGQILLNKLLHVMQIKEGNLDLPLQVNPKELADEFDFWFYSYTKLWRERNRESELHRLRDTFMALARKLRSY